MGNGLVVKSLSYGHNTKAEAGLIICTSQPEDKKANHKITEPPTV